jgi:LPXTG-motif cell wall-anchored protein
MGALMSGMIILMVAAFLLVTGIAVMAYRRRKTGAED